jgi:hypothetical protein
MEVIGQLHDPTAMSPAGFTNLNTGSVTSKREDNEKWQFVYFYQPTE